MLSVFLAFKFDIMVSSKGNEGYNIKDRRLRIMKGYFTDSGYMGYVNGEYMLFASEDDYSIFFDDSDEDEAA